MHKTYVTMERQHNVRRFLNAEFPSRQWQHTEPSITGRYFGVVQKCCITTLPPCTSSMHTIYRNKFIHNLQLFIFSVIYKQERSNKRGIKQIVSSIPKIKKQQHNAIFCSLGVSSQQHQQRVRWIRKKTTNLKIQILKPY